MTVYSKEKTKPSVLCIAGNDSAGMAGLSADQRVIHALGAHALTAITANTAQNSDTFTALNPVSIDVLTSQIHAVAPLSPKAVKIGLIANENQVHTISEELKDLQCDVIYDPVLSSTSGAHFSSNAFIETLKSHLLAHCTLVTPNIPEAEKLAGIMIRSDSDIETAAKKIHALGCKSVLIKGGHNNGALAQDFFYCDDRQFWLNSKRADYTHTRGTGCVFSSSIATSLALGYSLYDAIVIGKMTINQGLRHAYGVSDQKGSLHINGFPTEQQDLPTLSAHANGQHSEYFAECNETPMGLYPVVDSAEWLARLLPLGISIAQLRVKTLDGDALESEIINAINIGKKYNCRLFINDYWQLAIKHNAYGVHLGQEDLDDADILAIKKAGLRLGTSTHCHYEVARAHAYKPSYIAIGPVYPTTTKDMPWVPHGPKGFQYWRQTLNYPLVAIGGINRDRIPGLVKSGADSIAMITAITLSDQPEHTARDFMELISESKH